MGLVCDRLSPIDLSNVRSQLVRKHAQNLHVLPSLISNLSRDFSYWKHPNYFLCILQNLGGTNWSKFYLLHSVHRTHWNLQSIIHRGFALLLSLQMMGRLFPHHLGHYLGLDTHDTMLVDRNTELEPGMVVTVEPGVYIPHDYQLQGSSAATESVVGLLPPWFIMSNFTGS